MIKITVLLTVLFSLYTNLLQAQDAGSAYIQTTDGKVSGIVKKESGIQIFKGIPFAAPPVGELRWKAPQPVEKWTGVKKCDVFAASAIQTEPVPFYLWSQEFIAPAIPLSEDCLYLNIWNTTATETKKPVIVWIHGGGFTGGSGSVPVYDGEAMAKKGVVFVTINYRLGVFGFLAHPGLTEEAAYRSSGNYGLLDQLAALQWIQKNIAAFGGDPGRVTVAGQSAGAFSICALMASPLSKGLFQRAIAHSGGMFDMNGRLKGLNEAEQAGVQFAAVLQSSSVAELRKLPAQQVLAAGAAISGPVIDGYLLPTDIYTIFKEGKQMDIPLLTGWNSDEGFAPQLPLNAERFEQFIRKKYGDLSADMLRAFPAGTDEEAAASQKSMSRDQFFAWQNHTWARMHTATGKQRAWLYVFSKKPPGEPDNGAFHSSEIPYALHTLDLWNRPWKASDRKVEEMMSSYWVNFAATGDPNASGFAEWPSMELNTIKAMEFNTNSKVISHPLKKEMEALDKYQATLRNGQ